MDSFTLGLLPKIDFNTNTTTTLRQRLESKLISTITPKLYSLSSKEFNTERFSLGNVRMVAENVWTDNCATDFPKELIFFPE
jgi:hypothetical protein